MNLYQKLHQRIQSLNVNWSIIVKVLIGVIVLFAVATTVNQCHVQSLNKYEQQVQEWKTNEQRLLVKNDSLAKELVIIRTTADRARASADSLSRVVSTARARSNTNRTRIDTTLAQLRNELPDTCKSALALAEAYRTEVIALDAALEHAEERDVHRLVEIDALRTGLSALTVQNDSLTHLVRTVPVYKEPKLLGFIPLPDRKTSAVIGFVSGVAVTAVVISAIN